MELTIVRFLPWLPALTTACGISLPDPRVHTVDPPVGFVGAETVITITGEHFYPAVDVEATNREPQVNTDFTVALRDPVGDSSGGPVEVELPGALLLDYETLQAVVPPGLEARTYDVVVTTPQGASGDLTNAYTVSSTRAEQLSISTDLIVYEVQQQAVFEVALLDRDGNRVLADERVVIYVEADDGTTAVQFEAGGLDDQTPLGPAAVSGRLGPDGSAIVAMTSETPDQLSISVQPLDGDSPVASGQVVVLFEPGSDLGVRLELLSEDFVATAGEPFPIRVVLEDQFGNDTPAAAASLVLRSSCSAWVEAVDVVGSKTISPVLTTATESSGACPAERIQSVLGIVGSSDPFEVRPGEASRFDVLVTPTETVAGESTIQVIATPTDSFGNRTVWQGNPVLRDEQGAVLDAECIVDELVVCSLRQEVAGADLRIEVDGGGGVLGTSGPYAVLPGAPASLDVSVLDDPVIADDLTRVRITIRDRYGNAVDGSTFAPSDFTIREGSQPLTCTELVSPDRDVVYGCEIRGAGASRLLIVELVPQSLQSLSNSFDVLNGTLATVSWQLSLDSIIAGELLEVGILGSDAWGNPHLVPEGVVVDVVEQGGGGLSNPIVLDSLGAGQVSVRPVTAGQITFGASAEGVSLGQSPTVTVLPALAERIEVVTQRPWQWVAEPSLVQVRTLDPFGNIADEDGVVTLESATGSAAATAVGLTAGVGLGEVTWSSPSFEEQLQATGLGVNGLSDAFWVVERCQGSGPESVLSFPGPAGNLVCEVEGEGSLLVSLEASTAPGFEPLTHFAAASGNSVVFGTDDAVTLTLKGMGEHVIEGLAATAAGCAAETTAVAWMGPADGSPTGPLMLEVPAAPLTVGQAPESLVVAEVMDCEANPAEGSAIKLRVDRGELADLASLSDGLYATVDATGNASARLDMTTAHEGPLARIVASVPSGAASGLLEVPLEGDILAPRVLEQSPSGVTMGLVDSIVVEFSEGMDPRTLDPTAFSLVGPAEVAVDSVTPLLGGQGAVVLLSEQVDASAGEWEFSVSEALTDVAGNALDGEETGLPAPYVGRFGGVPLLAVQVDSCLALPAAFRPDGLDGPGLDADGTDITATSVEAPARWMISVFDSAATLVRRWHEPGFDDTLQTRWDGRDGSGKVVEEGSYVIEVDAIDAFDNRGGACTADLAVVQEVP